LFAVVVAEIKENIISDLNFKDRLPVESSSFAVVVVVVVAFVVFVDFFVVTSFEELFYIQPEKFDII
jgi:hypothetical protein